MIDPYDVTKFDRSYEELEEYLLFCICAAGHKAVTSAKGLDRFLNRCPSLTGLHKAGPFEQIRKLNDQPLIRDMLRVSGIGNHGLKSGTFLSLARSGINLKACTVKDLEAFKGIGEKTSRFFLLHSRRDQRIACLDTHVRKWLQHLGYEGVPNQAPSGKKYLVWEQVFLSIADHYGMKPADLDLEVWTAYTDKKMDTLPYVKVNAEA